MPSLGCRSVGAVCRPTEGYTLFASSLAARPEEMPMTTVAFLGPVGTHTEEALLSLELPDITPQPYASIDDVFIHCCRRKTRLTASLCGR